MKLPTPKSEEQSGDSKEISSVTSENTVNGLESFLTSQESSGVFNKIPEESESYHLPSDSGKENKDSEENLRISFTNLKSKEDIDSSTFTDFPKEKNNPKLTSTTFQQVTKEQKPEEYIEAITSTESVTEKTLTLKSIIQNSVKVTPTTTKNIESELHSESTTGLLKNSEEKSTHTFSEQFLRSTSTVQPLTVNENIAKSPAPELNVPVIVVDGAATTETIENRDSATNAHDTEIKETTYRRSYTSLTNKHAVAKNTNLKFTNVGYITLSTTKETIVPNVNSHSDFAMNPTATTSRATLTDAYAEDIKRSDMQTKLDNTLVTKSTEKTAANAHTKNETTMISGVPKGFLVFSDKCRIPDLDPMHPSIRHLIEKTPPLDCSVCSLFFPLYLFLFTPVVLKLWGSPH